LHVEPATNTDLTAIREAYAHARAIQQQQGSTVWPEFTDEAIIAELNERRLFQVCSDGQLLGVFTVAYEDAAIWGERERGAHIYLHRIARSPTSPAGGLVDAVLAWARTECIVIGRAGLRVDTWSNNVALIAFYQRRGFDLVGHRLIDDDPRLPAHYHGREFALLERACER